MSNGQTSRTELVLLERFDKAEEHQQLVPE